MDGAEKTHDDGHSRSDDPYAIKADQRATVGITQPGICEGSEDDPDRQHAPSEGRERHYQKEDVARYDEKRSGGITFRKFPTDGHGDEHRNRPEPRDLCQSRSLAWR